MNSFTSALNFQDQLMKGMPSFIDTISGNYVPYFIIPNITISESFSPLTGINITFPNQSTLSFQYSRTKMLSLSLIDYQVSEANTTEYALNFNIVKHNVKLKLPFVMPNLSKIPILKLSGDNNNKNNNTTGVGNDLSFGLSLAMSDQFTSNTTLDQASNYSTGGQKVFSFQPSINYIINNRFNIRLFYTQTRTIPYISTAPPIITTNAGVEVKMSLQ